MYRISVDGYPLLDPNDTELIVVNPKVTLETNKVGSASFKIYDDHPNFERCVLLKSIFEISDEVGTIFRGRMTSDSSDFYNGKAIDLEGSLAFLNDSVIRPFKFPEDFTNDTDYTSVAASGNVVEYFLTWLIEQHNAQVESFQQLHVGNVTVSDPNNYITRSSSAYLSAWSCLRDKLFDSSLGGYICVRYESSGTYIDYLSDFTLTNTQTIEFGQNLLDLMHEKDGSECYSAVIPLGAQIETEEEESDTLSKPRLTIESLPDGDITSDIVKSGDTIYSRSAVDSYGWIYAPVDVTTWDDVTDQANLRSHGVRWLGTQGMLLSESVTVSAADLHFTDDQIASFRINRKVNVSSSAHGISDSYRLTKLAIDLVNPQNTKITVGAANLTMTDQTAKSEAESIQRIRKTESDIAQNRTQTSQVKNQLIEQSTTMMNTFNQILFSTLESYVSTGNYEEFRRNTEAALQILSDSIELKFVDAVTRIDNVNGDLQQTNNTLSKYFEFTADGLTIKSGESAISLKIDNDEIVFLNQGAPFGRWDGTNFHTGNVVIDVEERAQFGNFAFIPRSDGSLQFLKVGG